MDMSFLIMPYPRGIGVRLHTTCTSNSSLSFMSFVRVRRFEAAYGLVLFWPALPVPRPGRDREARESMNIIMVRKDYSVRSSQPNPYIPARPGATTQEQYHTL
jgi:hypothetical protein